MTTSPDVQAANKKVARRVLELITRYEFVDALELLSTDAVWWEFGRVNHTKAELLPDLEFLKSRLTSAGITMRIRDVIAEGDRVALTADETATTVEGKNYSNAFTFWFTIRDGLVAEVNQYHDSAMVQATIRATEGRRDYSGVESDRAFTSDVTGDQLPGDVAPNEATDEK
jgi:ketosteroid isomerase-like protein